MQIDFTKEICLCFENQYPNNDKEYLDFVFGNKGKITKQLRLYERMLNEFGFITKLIIKLQGN